MKQRFTLLAAVAMLFCGLTLFAQDRTITGKVTSDDGSVLPVPQTMRNWYLVLLALPIKK